MMLNAQERMRESFSDLTFIVRNGRVEEVHL